MSADLRKDTCDIGKSDGKGCRSQLQFSIANMSLHLQLKSVDGMLAKDKTTMIEEQRVRLQFMKGAQAFS